MIRFASANSAPGVAVRGGRRKAPDTQDADGYCPLVAFQVALGPNEQSPELGGAGTPTSIGPDAAVPRANIPVMSKWIPRLSFQRRRVSNVRHAARVRPRSMILNRAWSMHLNTDNPRHTGAAPRLIRLCSPCRLAQYDCVLPLRNRTPKERS